MLLIAACGPTVITVRGFAVDCRSVPIDECRGVADLGINNLARNRPTGLIWVEGRASCPVGIEAFFDPRRCWNVHLPVGDIVACMVVARRNDGAFAQAGGDQMAGKAGAPHPTGRCPA